MQRGRIAEVDKGGTDRPPGVVILVRAIGAAILAADKDQVLALTPAGRIDRRAGRLALGVPGAVCWSQDAGRRILSPGQFGTST